VNQLFYLIVIQINANDNREKLKESIRLDNDLKSSLYSRYSFSTRVVDQRFFKQTSVCCVLALLFLDDNRKVWTSHESEFVDSSFFSNISFSLPLQEASMRLSVPDVPTGIPAFKCPVSIVYET